MRLRSAILLLLTPTSLIAAQSLAPTYIEGSNVKWEIDSTSAKVAAHLGRQALFLRANAPMAFASGVEFADGTIEFDIAPMPGGNFVGLVFRYATPLIHDNIYFRLHRSGQFEAVQYAPRLHTTAGAWQIFPEFMGAADLPTQKWTHVRAEIRGSRMEVFVGDSAKPIVVVPRLRGLASSGRVALWGRVNNRPEEWTAAISNIRILPRNPQPRAAVDTVKLPNGTLTGWRVAGPYAAPDSSVIPPLPSAEDWKAIELEEDGLVNISRNVAKPAGGRHVVFLRNTVRAQAPRLAPIEIGYSEDVAIMLNGTPLYRGTNAFSGRYPGFLGLLALAETVYLPLKAGDNDLVVAVGERAFGWGFKARLAR